MIRFGFVLRSLLLFGLLVVSGLGSHAHQFQVEPIVAVLRPQEKWLYAEFTGNVQDITQSVEAKPEDRRGDGFTTDVEQRVLAYFNERFLVEQGGEVGPAQWVSL
ncbi:MAG: hypothetical protein ACOVT5_16990, partial [Armatimonadaceae bacterium]